MRPEAQRRLGHALTRSAVERQIGIVQEALQVALLADSSLRQTWPDGDALLAGCARMRDWEHEVALADLVGVVDGHIKEWQEKLAEGLRLQQEERAKLDQQIAENLRRLGYE